MAVLFCLKWVSGYLRLIQTNTILPMLNGVELGPQLPVHLCLQWVQNNFLGIILAFLASASSAHLVGGAGGLAVHQTFALMASLQSAHLLQRK